MKERIHTSIPVTPNLAATFTLTHVDAIGAISIDTDGNGIKDVTLTSRTPEQTVNDLRAYIASLDILPLAKLMLLTEVTKIEKHLLKGKAAQALRELREYLPALATAGLRVQHYPDSTHHRTSEGLIPAAQS